MRLLAPAAVWLGLWALAPTGGGPTAQAQPGQGLQGLRRVAVEVALEPDHPAVLPEELERRLEEALRQSQPAPRVDPDSTDLLRLIVSVRNITSSELRGFYLPLSGSYGIGTVRLAVIRGVTIPGVAAPVPAVVWQAERHARAPWRGSAAEIAGFVDELVGAFLDDYRQAGRR